MLAYNCTLFNKISMDSNNRRRTDVGRLAVGRSSVGRPEARAGAAEPDLVHQCERKVAPRAQRLLDLPVLQRALVHRDARQRGVLVTKIPTQPVRWNVFSGFNPQEMALPGRSHAREIAYQGDRLPGKSAA